MLENDLKVKGTVLMLWLCLAAVGAWSQESRGARSIGERFAIRSDILNEERFFSISLPSSYQESTRAYPLLIILDGEDYFPAFSGMLEYYSKIGTCPELIAVGIEASDRWRDYTPTRADIPDGTPVPNSGGAGAFLRFINLELMKFVRANYRVSDFHVLYGHSIAGLFVMNALYSESSGFSAFIATSPSLWWDDECIKKQALEENPASRPAPSHLFITMGSEGATMLEPVLSFTRLLESRSGDNITWKFKHFEDVDHQTMPLKAFPYGLEYVFSDWRMPQETYDQGLDAVITYYENLSHRYRQKLEVPENILNRLGYIELNKGNVTRAVEIFELMAAKYPESANAYDSLGEAYLKADERDNAVRNYKKSLELNPYNENARKILIKLGYLK